MARMLAGESDVVGGERTFFQNEGEALSLGYLVEETLPGATFVVVFEISTRKRVVPVASSLSLYVLLLGVLAAVVVVVVVVVVAT